MSVDNFNLHGKRSASGALYHFLTEAKEIVAHAKDAARCDDWAAAAICLQDVRRAIRRAESALAAGRRREAR